MLNNYFDKIYCINLDRRQDKWKSIKNKFNNIGLKIEKFSAIDGLHIPQIELKNYKSINKFEVGCMISHYEIIKNAKKNNYKRILIFEDDILFIEKFEEKFKNEIKQLKDWKILYLGASQHYWNELEYFKGFYYAKKTDGCFAYALDNSIYDEILKTEKKDNPIDYKLWEIQKKYYKECFVFFPNIVIPDVSDSDIREPRDNKTHEIKMKWNIYKYK